MALPDKKAHSDRFLRWLFIASFWAIWLGLPFLMQNDEDDRFRRFMIAILPANLTNVPLFLFNAEWLGPRMLRRRGVATYLFTLIGLAVFFIVLQGVMKNWLLAPDAKGVLFHAFKSVPPVLSVVGISTGYALAVHLVREEKNRQEEQQERLTSELSFLRSQISPHFIFNVLNSIVYLIRTKSAQAEPVTLQLSELMRYMLYESADAQIPLNKELDYLKNYIELQKIRFGEDVDIRLHIEGAPAGQVIEPMLMIPFVENAFKHGVGLIQSPEIDISLKIKEKQLFFSVKNKITPEPPTARDDSSGIGLQNVRRRLELLYPSAHRLDLRASEGWFLAELTLDFGGLK
jgi:two-component system, LytTR family, sensor kinase